MGQVLHGSATTTHAVRAAIQRSQASVPELAGRYDLNEKTVRKWRKRISVEDARMGPKEVRSSVMTPEEEAMCVGLPPTHAAAIGRLSLRLAGDRSSPFPVCPPPAVPAP